MLDRRQLLLGGLGVGAAVAGGAYLTAQAAPQPLDNALPDSALPDSALPERALPENALRIGYLPITDAAPLLVAHGTGMFDPDTPVRRPIMFRGWAALAEAFLTRQVDAVHLLMPLAVQLRFALGARAKMLAWNHTNGSSLTVRNEITRLDQLAGTRVAIPHWWSIHNIVLQEMLEHAGLRPVIRTTPSRAERTVELVVMSPSDMVPALDGGSLGGYIVADPFNAIAEIKHVGRIHRFVGDVWRDHACCVLLTHQDLIDEHPHRVQGLVNAVTAAQHRINQDRHSCAALLADGYLPQPTPAIQRALSHPPHPLRHPAWHGDRIGFQPYPFPGYTRDVVSRMRRTLVDGDTSFLHRVDPASAHGQLVNDRFVRSALHRLGGPGSFGLPADLQRIEEVRP